MSSGWDWRALLARLDGAPLTVVGDVMLDVYVWGEVRRISPEAPVQVVRVNRRSYRLGGAANVALNAAAAGLKVRLFGVVGDDAAGRKVREIAEASALDASGIVTDSARATTVKTRIVARGQQLLRLDEEDAGGIAPEARDELTRHLLETISPGAVVVVSDYAKGVVDADLVPHRLAARRRGGAPPRVVVDPKSADLSRYAGCYAVTPNLAEAEAAAGMTIVGDADLAEAARRIRAACGATTIVVTLGERGLALSRQDGALEIVPSRARDVYDVTGAGDTLIAYYAAALAARAGDEEAAALANEAAGVAVGKVGAAIVSPPEILDAATDSVSSRGKLVDLPEAVARIDGDRARGRRIVFTNGCFDLLHAGHVHLLQRARSLGDVLVVGVNSDASVRRLKGPGRPVVRAEDRIRVLAALDAVTYVFSFDGDTPLDAIRELRPDVLVKGGDYTEDRVVGADFVRSYGGRVELIPLAHGRSTTALLAALKGNGDGE